MPDWSQRPRRQSISRHAPVLQRPDGDLMPREPASSSDGVLANGLLDDVGLGTDVEVGFGVDEAMPLAEGAVEAQDELADEGPVGGVVIIAEDRELQPLRREAAAQSGPALSGRALGPVLDEPVDFLLDVRA